MFGPRGGNTAGFARRLREMRMQLDWSRQDLAARVGVNANSVTNWENGRHFPHIHIRDRLCEVLETSPQAICLPPYDCDW
jgi:transcriptional regulator with XRE-family HTH domain